MPDMNGELWIQSRNATTFRYTILCILTLVTPKLMVVCWRCTYRMSARLPQMSIICVRGGCKILMARYASKCASQSLRDKPFLRIQCTQTNNLKTSGHIWKFSILNDFYVIGDIYCVVCSCTRDLTGELRSETSIGRSLIRHCVRILQVCRYTHRFLVCN